MAWWLGIISYIGLIFAGFSSKLVREWHVLSWTPFASAAFFVLAALVVALLHLARPQLERRLNFATLLAGLNLVFFMLLFASPLHILAFTGYFYLLQAFAVRAEVMRAKSIALGLSLVPLLVARSTKEIQFIGLSYITFRAFHMLSEKDRLGLPKLREFFLYLTFFPTIVAGPIDRFPRFKADLEQGWRGLQAQNLALGLNFVLLGMCQKFILAELVSRHWLQRPAAEITSRLVDMYAYSAFLYFDFAGYSTMAMGLGYMLGVILPKNFDRPYLSSNPQDFWRRFHITLGDWLKDYFFLPLYKAFSTWSWLPTSPLFKQNLALFLTFLLMGFWNGNHRHYIVSGALFGLYSALHNSYVYLVKRKQVPDLFAPFGRMGHALAIGLTLHAVSFALYVFSGRLPF